jgi:hypothetical protein
VVCVDAGRQLMVQDKDLDLVGGVGAACVEHHPAQQLANTW